MNTQRALIGFLAGGALFWAFLYLYPIAPQPTTQNATPTVSAEDQKPSESEIAFTVLDEGAVASNAKNRKNYAIYTQEEMMSFWKIAHGNDGKKGPTVDFTKNYVIAVFAGTKPTTGYSIAVAHVKESGSARNVDVVIKTPGEGCTPKDTKTSPYQFILVPVGEESSLSHNDVDIQTACN